MKLTNTDIQKLYDAIITCGIGGIDDILIDSGFIHGVSSDRSCLIISDHRVPNFGTHKVGLSRLSKLRQRLELFALGGKMEDGLTLDAKESERGEITQLELALGKNKLQYRCTSTANIRAPKSVNDEPAFLVTINKKQLALMLQALRVMGAGSLVIGIKLDGTVSFKATDSNNDSFVLVNDSPVERLAEQQESVVYYYAADAFVSVVRASGEEAAL